MRRLLWGLAVAVACGAAVAGVLAASPTRAQEDQPQVAGPELREEPGGELSVRITPEMVRYSHTRYALYFAGALVEVVALWALLRFRVSARLRDFAERRGRNGVQRAYLYYPLLTLVYSVLTLPLAFYSSYLLPHQYGLSNQTPGGWVLDLAKRFAIGAVIAPPLIAFLYWSIRRSPRRWWLAFWLASIPLLIAAVLLSPLIIDPLFNRFGPLQDEALRTRILALAEQAGIENSRVFEVDASVRTKQVNAYVTGLGGSARIVLWDTLLQRLDDDEVLFVMAHEMGHYVERHVPIGLALSICGSLVLLWAVDRGSRRILARKGAAWEVRGLDDLASLPLLLLLLSVLNFLGSPVESAISRTIESRADQFALRLTNAPRAGISAYVKLAELNLAHPSPPPFIEYWMFSHPSLQKRINAAREWEQRQQPAIGGEQSAVNRGDE